jgi:hypothetical protein
VAVAADQGHLEQARGQSQIGVSQGQDPVFAHVARVLEVAARRHGRVHIRDRAAVYGVPAGADDGIHIAPVQAGVSEGQPGRLVLVFVIQAVRRGRPARGLADADNGDLRCLSEYAQVR